MYEWIDEYCRSKPGAAGEFKVEWEAFRYMLGDKMFAMQGEEKSKRPVLTLKCDPVIAIAYREQYDEVIPGYYMNKEHWNSVYLDGNFPEQLLREMIDMSHDLVLKSLPKKKQAAILAAEG